MLLPLLCLGHLSKAEKNVNDITGNKEENVRKRVLAEK